MKKKETDSNARIVTSFSSVCNTSCDATNTSITSLASLDSYAQRFSQLNQNQDLSERNNSYVTKDESTLAKKPIRNRKYYEEKKEEILGKKRKRYAEQKDEISKRRKLNRATNKEENRQKTIVLIIPKTSRKY